MPVITPAQVRAQVLRLTRKNRENGKPQRTETIGIYAPGDWHGGKDLLCGEKIYRVVSCGSDLDVREALCEHAGKPLVILSGLDETQLSEDVRIRFAKRTLVHLSGKAVLLDLFQARSLDPPLLNYKWLVGALIERTPESGFPPVPGGMLDAETA